MTDKHSFLGRLKDRLISKGVSEADAEPYLLQFDKYYDRMVNDDLATAETLLDIESIADNIASQVKERYEEIDRLAAMSMAPKEADDEQIPEDIPASEEALAEELSEDSLPTMEAQIPAVVLDDEDYGILEEDDAEPVVYEDYGDEFSVGEAVDELSDSSTRLPDYVEPEKIQESKMFWVLFAASLPVTLPLAIIVLLIFGVMWGALAVVTAAAVAVLIGAVCAGTAVSLVGIIYGIVRLGEAVPVGVYEIGVGIVIAGVTTCVGILIYNFAVRLMPILFKLVSKLFKYTVNRLKELFNYLRKESARL